MPHDSSLTWPGRAGVPSSWPSAGRIALPLAAHGVHVTGIDGDVDLVYLVFDSLGNVASQEAQVATFENAARHLRP